VYVAINGLLSFDKGTGSFRNTAIPNPEMPSYSVMGLWGDLFVYKDTPQGLYYEVSGDNGTRTIVFEWYTSRYHDPTEYYHFTVEFSEASPAIIVVKYYKALDKGRQSSIGVQGGTGKLKSAFSFLNCRQAN
jgi:hypothetical protein